MATSWGTRKALGRRYSSDPALELEQQRLQQEYSLIPAREARALQASQYAQSLAETQRQSAVNYRLQKDQIAAQEKASMGGTIGNVVQAIPMTYMLGKQAGLWGTKAAGTGAAGGSTQLTATGIPQAQQGVNYGSTQYQPFTTDPAIVDSAVGAGAAGIGGYAGTAAAYNAATTPGAAALTPVGNSGIALTNEGLAVNIGDAGTAGTAAGTGSSGVSMAGAGMGALAAGSVILAHEQGKRKGGDEGLTIGTPFSVATAPQAMAADEAFGSSNYITQQANALQRQEEGFYKGLDALWTGDVRGWASETVNAVLTPVASIFGGAGKVKKAVSRVFKKCIIITACTSEDSPEVNIARKYRDGHMDRMELRGYYMIADRVVPMMERSKWFKRIVKWFLVDGIIDYCAYAVGDKADLPGRWSAFITKAFLSLCAYKGSRRSQYIRANGEVY